MAKFFATALLVLLVSTSVKMLVPMVDACYLDSISGGCPDRSACLETCRPCYRNIGTVDSYCVAPGGGTPYWICRCEFKNGAPCPPSGPPTCPKPPALGPRNINVTVPVV